MWSGVVLRGQPVVRLVLIVYMLLLHMWLAYTVSTVRLLLTNE